MCGRDIEKSICREMSGNLESGMVAVGKCVCVGVWVFVVAIFITFKAHGLRKGVWKDFLQRPADARCADWLKCLRDLS